MHHMWRLSEAGPQNLGLACTDGGLLLGHTSLIERRDGRFVVRARAEIERLFKRAHDREPQLDRLMSGLARVASAMNANDQCLARIAAVHLQIPDLASAVVRDALSAEESLIKYARDEGTGAANWNPELHPRVGTQPNPGWFATTGGASHDSTSVRLAENDGRARRSDGSPDAADDWVHLPPAKRIDELGDFLEWLANAKPEDEQTIRAEINRYWGSAGDVHALGTLNFMLSQVLKPGTTRQERQQILELIDNYSRYDPAEVGQFYDQLFDLFALLGSGLFPRTLPKRPVVPPEIEFETAPLGLSQEQRAAIWKLGWAKRGKVLDRVFRKGNLHDLSRTIDDLVDDVAISNKSVDLNAATYQDSRRLLSRLNQYLEKLEAYSGTDWGGDSIKATDVASRALRVIIPIGSMTPVQREAIEAATRIARSKNLRLIVTEF
jgi:contact-dependent growth inhibition (CDI) system restriction endonuclease-like protein